MGGVRLGWVEQGLVGLKRRRVGGWDVEGVCCQRSGLLRRYGGYGFECGRGVVKGAWVCMWLGLV